MQRGDAIQTEEFYAPLQSLCGMMLLCIYVHRLLGEAGDTQGLEQARVPDSVQDGATMTAATRYAGCIDAANAQRVRIQGRQPPGDPWASMAAEVFRHDPHRELDANLEVVAAYVQPGDVVIDVGGGAGRVALPLALKCKEVISIDPSPSMCVEFEGSAAEASISNARVVQADWLETEPMSADLIFSADVVYFVRDIGRFIEKINGSCRRAIITVWSVPPPNGGAKLFRLVHGEEPEPAPGHCQLLPVLWDMGILPDVRVLPDFPRWADRSASSHDGAIKLALDWVGVETDDQERVRSLIEANFQDLFSQNPGGFRPLWFPYARELLITWETAQGC